MAKVYPLDFEERIGFASIRQIIADLALCSLGKEGVLQSHFSSDRKSISLNAVRLSEFKSLLFLDRPFPQEGYADFSDTAKIISRVDGVVGLEELHTLRAALNAVLEIQRYLAPRKEAYPQLVTLSESYESPQEVIKLLNQIVAPDGTMLDNASPALLAIRKRLQANKNAVEKRLNALLSSAIKAEILPAETKFSMRNGRLVLPVPAGKKAHFKGVVQGRSASEQTLFIEPFEALEAANDIEELLEREREEMNLILCNLCENLRAEEYGLADWCAFLATFDTLRAKALFAVDAGGAMPIISERAELYLREAVHPQLLLTLRKQGKTAVPLSLQLAEKRMLIISGPNAGGKSVCLKTAAISVYMLQCGFLPLVKENSEMGIFKSVMINIGDAQSMANDLSTYSGHLAAMRYFIRSADEHSLCLIDELGSGTEPLAGGAIAEAILEELIESDAISIITTHYSNIKGFATKHTKAINGAMRFNLATMEPTFELEIGMPGSSYAFEVAARIGLPQEIVNRAKEIAGEDYINLEKQLRAVNREKRAWRKRSEKARQDAKKAEMLRENLENATAQIKEQERETIKKARKEAEAILRESNRIVEQTIREIKEANAEKEGTKKARRKLQEHTQQNRQALADMAPKLTQDRQEESASTTLRVGSKARIVGSESIGEVVTLGEKSAVLAMGSMLTTLPIERLEPISETQYKKINHANSSRPQNEMQRNIAKRRLNFQPEIDIRGVRGEEAIHATEQLIDDAIMMKADQVRILHGKGNGILRDIIRDYLKGLPGITWYGDESEELGGAGITVVKFH